MGSPPHTSHSSAADSSLAALEPLILPWSTIVLSQQSSQNKYEQSQGQISHRFYQALYMSLCRMNGG